MDDTIIFKRPTAPVEEIQSGWFEFTSRISRLEAEYALLEQENQALRSLLERVVEHRQKSHGQLVLILACLVSKLPISDVGIVVGKLMEHTAQVNEICAALSKGTAEANMPQPAVLKTLEDTKRDLLAALKPAVEEFIQTEPPLDAEALRLLITQPELFSTPAAGRANRCYVKGQVPRERILREFGEAALIFFNDMTTDAKRNPKPKPEEIVLTFKPDFETLFQQNAALLPDKRPALLELHRRIQRSKANTPEARAQKAAFQKMSFLLEVLHYYANQNTEAPEAVFAQRLPVLVEQLVVTGAQEQLDEKLIEQVEGLLAFIINLDHRLTVINNVGKSGDMLRTLKFVLRLRAEKQADPTLARQTEIIVEFVKHLIPPPPQKAPPPAVLAAPLKFLREDMQRLVVKDIMASDRLGRQEAVDLGKALGQELNLSGLEEEIKTQSTLTPEQERQLAWDKIKELIKQRAEPAAIALAIRDRLHAKYEADEVKQSWVTLIEADVVTFIRAFCQLPYLADGRTDPIARAVMETYVTRLTHEKYAATYTKVLTSLKNMFKANPQAPMLLNFVALVKWVDADAANKISADIGMPA